MAGVQSAERTLATTRERAVANKLLGERRPDFLHEAIQHLCCHRHSAAGQTRASQNTTAGGEPTAPGPV
ncbi:hypothetical protein D3C79_1063790 [compost metagenome]